METLHRQAAQSFAREGFVAHRFTPYIQLSPLDQTPPAYQDYYTHGQPLSFLFYGWLAKIGWSSRLLWRLFAIMLTLMGILAYYAMLRAGNVESNIAGWATVALAWSPALAYWGMNFTLHYSAMPLLTFGAMALWLQAKRHPRSAWIWAILWMTLFLQYLSSGHTYVITTQLFFWIYAWLDRRWSWREMAFLLSPHAAAIGLLVMKNVWLLGGLGAALMNDILPYVLWRTANLSLSDTPAQQSYTFARLEYAKMLWHQFQWAGGKLAIAAFIVAGLRSRLPSAVLTPHILRMATALLVPAGFYAIVFAQEVGIHIFHTRNLMAGVALLIAAAGVRLCQHTAFRKAFILVVCIFALLGQWVQSARRLRPANPLWAKELAAQIPPSPRLVLCTTNGNYPLSYVLGKPYVFPRPKSQTLLPHGWWSIRSIEEVEDLADTVAQLWPGRSLGLVVWSPSEETMQLRKTAMERGWGPRWSTDNLEIYLIPSIKTESEATPIVRAPPPT